MMAGNKNYIKILEDLNAKYDEVKERANDIKVSVKSEESNISRLQSEIETKYGRKYDTEEQLDEAIAEKEARLEDVINKIQERLYV